MYMLGQVRDLAPFTVSLGSHVVVGMSSRLRPFGCVDNPEKPYVGKLNKPRERN